MAYDRLAQAANLSPGGTFTNAGDGWLRTRFTELGIIQFEDWTDTNEEYASLDAIAADSA